MLLFQDIAVIPMQALIPLLVIPELMDVAGQGAADAAARGPDDDHEDGHGEGLSLVDGLNGWQTTLLARAGRKSNS